MPISRITCTCRVQSDLIQLCEQHIKDFSLEDELKKTEAGLDNLAKVTIIHSRSVLVTKIILNVNNDLLMY